MSLLFFGDGGMRLEHGMMLSSDVSDGPLHSWYFKHHPFGPPPTQKSNF